MKDRLLRFLFNDRWIIALLATMILLLASGGVLLSRLVSAHMLRNDARSSSSTWVESLLQSADIPALIAGAPSSDRTKHILENASQVGDIYRYSIWDQTGRLVFISERMPSSQGRASLASLYGQRVADLVRSGTPFAALGTGEAPQNPPYFGVSWFPIKQNETVIGVIEIYIDQTADRALYQQSFFFTEGIIALAVLLAGGLPGFLVYRKMLDHRSAHAEAVYLAEHDDLTGTANRKQLADRAKDLLAWSLQNKSYIATMLLDLDRFKEINDSFGHNAGDEVLKEFARRLQSTTRGRDLVARLGGDEFVILQVGMEQPSGAGALAERLTEKLSEPYAIGDVQIACRASIGVAVAPTDAADWDQLLSFADVAMYKAKAEAGNGVCFFAAGMDAAFRERRELEADLRRAMDTIAFQLAYQPLFSCNGSVLLGFEALLRWPEGWEPQSPVAFIPVAEESGMIVPIGAWVLQTACRTAMTWTKPLKIAVNLSPVQFRHGDIVAVVQSALQASGLDPKRLELEVTESLLLHDTDAVLEQLTQLRALGISIALDDFGTGYSSLSYLWKFPFDTVKIDRSFVNDMTLDGKAEAIVNTIVALGNTLDLKVTAEGVETQAQVRALMAAGCDQSQGYLFGRPLSGSSALALVNAASAPNVALASQA
ncbi:MAG TPA: bifunctional diguanylate cyclase/phosphodiesterase [Granulicella sp.]|nr:bifunctional diguanylate cyclase/phosphodiesterase [Granulicella sp.]